MPNERPASLSTYKSTNVSPSKSKDDIEGLLTRVGATGFRWDNLVGKSEILEAALEWDEKRVAFRLAVKYGSESERRQKLRVLYWYLKTKIEAIQVGLIDLEEEFLPFLLTKTGETIYEQVKQMKTSQWLAIEAPKGED